MTNKNNVIKGLEFCTTHNNCRYTNGTVCPYYNDCSTIKDATGNTLERDALSLIKEQAQIIDQYKKADGFLAAHGWKW